MSIMDWKNIKWKSIWKLNKERVIFLLCAGMLLFVISIPAERPEAGADGTAQSAGIENNAGTSGRDTGTAGSTGAADGDGFGISGSMSYEEELENRIREILRGVDGVGEVDVMVVLKSSEEKVFRVDRTSSVSVSSTGTGETGGEERQEELSESTVLEGQNQGPMVEKELRPEISGIIISAEGGGREVVKAEVSQAMEALFGLPQHKIKVLKRVKEGV